MSISISSLNRPVSARTAAARRFPAAPASRQNLTFSSMQRRRAERRMTLAVQQLDHPGVMADLQRAMRS